LTVENGSTVHDLGLWGRERRWCWRDKQMVKEIVMGDPLLLVLAW